MSVRPVSFNSDGSIEVVHDELSHEGTIPSDEIVWSNNIGPGFNHNFIILTCPAGCGANSLHPVGGGAAPREVQQMFVNKTEAEGCACGNVEASTTNVPESHVKLNCHRMDGPTRWQLDDSPNISLLENSSKMFQVVYKKSDRLIVGLEPSGGVGPDNSVATIHDMAEYEVLMRTDPAYLDDDGDHIISSSPVG